MKKQQQGFTLIELMIVVAIVAILAGVGMPAYQNYTKKAQFSEVIGATAAYKTGVEICLNLAAKTTCDAGNNSIPTAVSGASNTAIVKTVDVVDGVITATTGTTSVFAAAETYILTPGSSAGLISWTVSGTCTGKDLC
ncbi:prepilin-type N-terminal cleavage/methylation domain-containing protein [Moritella sp.]|uniref:pilin n=1 Tax=Moritella sp. TaxID=78556 RepID=UPI001D94CA2E|nr:prepilin-type N-terminal cleavage/methylation domain-containing protein [Moritella sp.]MCJ8349733.1 prepilin-type N-terminal cleavage/methylation domain-containing protein [Moritella sp.]NQZ39906.1 prepilin-type N-terminal cleavage/methylation domain-containing protein [Moritella sp.]